MSRAIPGGASLPSKVRSFGAHFKLPAGRDRAMAMDSLEDDVGCPETDAPGAFAIGDGAEERELFPGSGVDGLGAGGFSFHGEEEMKVG